MKYIISDHAVIRFLERRYGMDIDAVRRQISDLIESKIPNPIKGRCTIKNADGMRLVLVDNNLITVTQKVRK